MSKEKVLYTVKSFIAKRHLLEEEQEITVALSGGADSVALLLILIELGYKVVALHCNFHLRGNESDRDESFVKSLCNRLGIRLYVIHFDTIGFAKEHKVSIEMAARDLRYDWFASIRKELGIPITAVAHHKDDQAETVLLNIIRGTGLRGLSGMKPRQGDIIRPLLCLGRREIESYLHERSEKFVSDSTNNEALVKRNVVRLDILPRLRQLNPEVDSALSNLAEVVDQSFTFYEYGIQHYLKENGVGESFPRTLLSKSFAQSLLHEWLKDKGFRPEQYQQIINSQNKHSGSIWYSATHRLLLDREILLLEKINEEDIQPQMKIEEVDSLGPSSPYTIFCDADLLHEPLTLRHPQKGEKMVPFGMKGSKLISDLMTNLKMDRFSRERQRVLCSGENVVWLVGIRPDNRFRVTDKTQRIVKISIIQ